MAAEWMKSRQTKFGAYAAVYVIVILGVLAAINFLANRYDQTWDSTKNKQFSLSGQTIKIVKGLKTDVKFTYFGQTDSFPQARDLLERYSAQSPKLHVDYVDPVKHPQEAKAQGFRSDSPVVVSSGSRQEGAKSLTEEEVSGALIRSQKSGERNVCFLEGAGEHSLDDSSGNGFSFAKQLLERDNYKTKSITLKPAASTPISSSADWYCGWSSTTRPVISAFMARSALEVSVIRCPVRWVTSRANTTVPRRRMSVGDSAPPNLREPVTKSARSSRSGFTTVGRSLGGY